MPRIGDIVWVEGCPCVVLETRPEHGIVCENARTERWPSSTNPRLLVIAPDGSLVLPNPFVPQHVDHTTPDQDAMTRHLQGLGVTVRTATRMLCPT